MNLFQTKNIGFEIKDIDTAGRRVKMALAKFNNIDSDGDIIIKGAFAKSIKERGPESESNRKIKFLRYHDFEHQIGVFKGLEETHDYLLGVADLGRATKGNDAFLDYQDGIITEHSIGFQTIQDKTEVREDGTQMLKELILWEGSAVTFGANSETPMFNVSKGNSKEFLEELNKKMLGLTNALKNGKGTDERLEQIEMNLRVCQLKYIN
jgi:HK97 family phage prohead protease